MIELFNKPRFTLIKFPLIGIGSFILLLIWASTFYPGGTENNPGTTGYLFSENYISDLGRIITPSGVSNITSVFIFIFAFLIMACVLFIFFYSNYTFYKKKFSYRGNMFKLGTFFGMCSSLCFLGVALAPVDINMKDHIVYAEWLFRFLFGGSVLLTISIYNMDKSTHVLSFGYFLIAFATGIYILLSDFKLNSILFSDVHVANVLTQKITTLSLVVGFLLVGFFNNRFLKQQ